MVCADWLLGNGWPQIALLPSGKKVIASWGLRSLEFLVTRDWITSTQSLKFQSIIKAVYMIWEIVQLDNSLCKQCCAVYFCPESVSNFYKKRQYIFIIGHRNWFVDYGLGAAIFKSLDTGKNFAWFAPTTLPLVSPYNLAHSVRLWFLLVSLGDGEEFLIVFSPDLFSSFDWHFYQELHGNFWIGDPRATVPRPHSHETGL